MKKLTYTMENYLEAIYELSGDGTGARLSDIASRLGVTKASANSAMSTLAQNGLITNEKYHEIFLTTIGEKQAVATSSKHRTIRAFFTEILHIDPSIADSDACRIEHVISEESVNAMRNYFRTKEKN
ncbi:MAG TPA: DtxR family iron (metal) dependent repressor [Ruminococcaceae bacterium]|mgnify:CR=1 FL=1|nr:DtxR family iron (metal) dependent repressor [Oscillospiraceae bacterium]